MISKDLYSSLVAGSCKELIGLPAKGMPERKVLLLGNGASHEDQRSTEALS